MKPATTTLAEIRGGLLNEDLGDALRTATEAVKETGKEAVITLKLKIKPNGAADPGDVQSVFVSDDITMKLPQLPKRASIFFVSEGNDLLRQQTIAGVEPAAKAG